MRLLTVVTRLATTLALAASFVRARDVSIVATARNLAVWTRYPGADPEAPMSATTGGGIDSFSTPPFRYLTLRLDLTF